MRLVHVQCSSTITEIHKNSFINLMRIFLMHISDCVTAGKVGRHTVLVFQSYINRVSCIRFQDFSAATERSHIHVCNV